MQERHLGVFNQQESRISRLCKFATMFPFSPNVYTVRLEWSLYQVQLIFQIGRELSIGKVLEHSKSE